MQQTKKGAAAAVVTGAASGMGRATAMALAEVGWEILALDLVEGGLIGPDGDIKTVSVDVSDRAKVKAAIDKRTPQRTDTWAQHG